METHECAFHTRRKIVSTTHDQQGFVLKQRFSQLLDFIVKLQYFANEIIEIFQAFDDLKAYANIRKIAFYLEEKNILLKPE